MDSEGIPAEDAVDLPLEAPLHAAVYAARPDIGAICRTHSPAAVRAGARAEVPPLTHGLGGLSGEIRLCERIDLVTDAGAGREIAVALGGADCLLIRANGAIATGADLAGAVVRARYLEERCELSADAPDGAAIGTRELESRSVWFDQERARAWAWMRWRYGKAS